MFKKTLIQSLTALSLIGGVALADDTTPNRQQALDKAIAAANANRAEPLVAGQHLYDAYEIAFQMGKWSMAKQLLATSVNQGVELAIWDQAALAEIFAREGNYIRAQERIDFAITNFKAAKCRTDTIWKKFSKALKKNDVKKINDILKDPTRPAIINTDPDVEAAHKLDKIVYRSFDTSFPPAITVNLVVSRLGNVQCVSSKYSDPKYEKMFSVLRARHFQSAQFQGKGVWQYGREYTVEFERGDPVINGKNRQDLERSSKVPTVQKSPNVKPKQN